MHPEVWRVSTLFPLYEISSHGRVRDLANRRVRTNSLVGGYPALRLKKNGKWTNCYIHRLVAEAFVIKSDSSHEVNHIDGNRENCYFENLEWVSRSENLKHAYRTGLSSRKNAKLTEATASEAKRLLKAGVTPKSVAKHFGVSPAAIYQIINGQTWKGVHV